MPRKIVIAPDSFKGTLSSIEVCEIIAQAIHKVSPECEIIRIPIADGGEGTVDAYLDALGGRKMHIRAMGPDMREVNAFYGILSDGRTAVIEMAAASGLTLTEENRDPSKTTTFGTGQLILHALEEGCTDFIIGIGGSATNDGGIGMAAALGVHFLDKNDETIALNGSGLAALHKIDATGLDQRVIDSSFTVACDVNNPLYGPNGAAFVFAPQKGADPKMVEELDENLKNYARIIQKQYGIDAQTIPGAGAAGGLGVALVVFAGAVVKSGINAILDTAHFDEAIRNADFIITGEGKMDRQTLMGKVPVGVGRRALAAGIPVMAIVGQTEGDIKEIYNEGISAVFTTLKHTIPFDEIKKNARKDLANTAEYAVQIFSATREGI
jgi:glycerate kinase